MPDYGPPQGGNWQQPQQPQQPQNPWSNQWGGQQNYTYLAQQRNPYNPPAEMPQKGSILNKDIPMTYIVLGTLAIWILIFGGVFGYMFTQPCEFVAFTSGDDLTLGKLEDKFGLNLRDNPEDCATFIRQMVMGTEPS